MPFVAFKFMECSLKHREGSLHREGGQGWCSDGAVMTR